MSQVVTRYSKALLELSKEKNILEDTHKDIFQISKTLSDNEALKSLLKDPLVGNVHKFDILNKIFLKSNPLTKKLFDVLLSNQRFELLDEISEKFIQMYKHLNNLKEIDVTTAIPIDKALKQKIITKIKSLIKGDFTIKNIIDKNIIGGFVIRIDDLQYDATMSSKLKYLKRTIG